jgi:hypothetical protein
MAMIMDKVVAKPARRFTPSTVGISAPVNQLKILHWH